MAWAAAIGALGGMMSGKGAKKAEKGRIKLLQEQLSDRSIKDSSATYFPGLFGNYQPSQNMMPTAQSFGQSQNPALQGYGNPGQGAAYAAQMLHRAGGGPVNAGQPYMVGEQGPEMFQPQQSGEIVPNQNMGGQMLGGGGYGPQPPQGGGGYTSNPSNSGMGSSIYGPPQQQNPMGGPAGPQQLGQAYNPNQTPGQMVTGHMSNLLQNPGQMSSIGYERAQEQANRGLNTSVQGIQGGLTGQGIDPRGGMGQMMMQTATMNAGKQRNEAARNQSMMEEALRREDIQMGSNMYTQFLQQLFGLAGMRSGALQSLPAPVNSMSGIGQGLSMGGYLMSQAMQNNQGSGGGKGAPGTNPTDYNPNYKG